MRDHDTVDLDDDEFERHWDEKFAAISRVYSLRPGHTLTQEDFDAIQKFDADFRENEQTAVDAFHAGYTQGLREGGSADIELMQARLDASTTKYAVEKALRAVAEQRAEKLNAHLSAMQRMAGDYLEPGPYIDRNGTEHTAGYEVDAFINDMIWMLDGPEQRAAQGIEARQGGDAEAGSVHESPVPEGQAPNNPLDTPPYPTGDR